MSAKDYVPDSYKNFRDWTQKILAELDPIATRIGWPAATLAACKVRVTRLRDAAQAVLDQQDALDSAIGQLELAQREELTDLRKDLGNLKSTRGFHEGDGKVLDILTTSAALDPATYQPALQAAAKRGRVILTGRKFGADSLNLYSRRKGETTWRLLAPKRVRFPFEDETPPLTPGALEEREYQAIGVLGDNEIGQPSPNVTAIFQP